MDFSSFRYLPFYLRKKTDAKLVIIESDDWGLQRATNEASLDWAATKYGKENFTRWTTDALETTEDLGLLFDLLKSYKNDFLYAPIITANYITHNFDYDTKDKLQMKPIDISIKKENPGLYQLVLDGMKDHVFYPQLHGYCHFNFALLHNYFNTEEGREEYANNYFLAKSTIKSHLSYLEGECVNANPNFIEQLEAAQEVFYRIFGFYSDSFIPPRYIIDRKLVRTMGDLHIKYLQAGNVLINSELKRYYVPFYMKFLGQTWLTRNCRLDPHRDYNFGAEQCILKIENAFKNKQPAVIDTHRVNYSGRFAPMERYKSLAELKKVLNYLKQKHPEILFITSDKVMDYI